MHPEERTVLLRALMRELEGVMRAEAALLRGMRLDRIEALQAEKSALAEAYERELRALRQAPEALAALAPAARESLGEAMRGFQAAVADNARRLGAARKVAEGVVRALGASLAASRRPQPYQAPGTAALRRGGGRPAQASPLALAVNHQA